MTALPEFVRRICRRLLRPVEGAIAVYRYAIHAVRLAQHGARERLKRPRRLLKVVPHPPLPIYTLWGGRAGPCPNAHDAKGQRGVVVVVSAIFVALGLQ